MVMSIKRARIEIIVGHGAQVCPGRCAFELSLQGRLCHLEVGT